MVGVSGLLGGGLSGWPRSRGPGPVNMKGLRVDLGKGGKELIGAKGGKGGKLMTGLKEKGGRGGERGERGDGQKLKSKAKRHTDARGGGGGKGARGKEGKRQKIAHVHVYAGSGQMCKGGVEKRVNRY